MKAILFKTPIFFLTVLMFGSCISQKKLEYFRDKSEEREFKVFESPNKTIQPFDELYISVTSLDEGQYNYFGNQGESYRMYGDESSMALISYTVNDSGYIYFPILGKVNLKDKTTDEAIEIMTNMLVSYFNQPSVIVKFMNKHISVLGEVNIPGYHYYTKDRISIFEVISLAGDISLYGNKKSVILIRETGKDKITRYSIDLTDPDIFLSEYYYLLPNDVVYVKPLKTKQFNLATTTYNLLLSTITIVILILRG